VSGTFGTLISGLIRPALRKETLKTVAGELSWLILFRVRNSYLLVAMKWCNRDFHP
jgi:hypothetical protein